MSRSRSGTWKPPAELLALRERLEEAFEASGESPHAVAAWTPAVDVAANERAVVVSVEVAGVSSEALVLEIEGAVLTLRGARDRAEGAGPFHRIERSMGAFERAIQLPGLVDPEAVEFQLARGVLTVRLPLAERPTSARRTIRLPAVATQS